MKRIVFLFLLLLPVLANGQTYFESETSWTMENSPCDPRDSNSFEEVYLTAENGAPLQMFKESPYITGKELVAEVKTEGEKVFFRYPGQEAEDWFLMYDFGLRPGEGCWVYCPDFSADSKNNNVFFQCEEIIAEDPQFGGLTTMIMSQKSGNFKSYGKWIKGAGDVRGVISNYSYFLDGFNSELIEIRSGNRIVYHKGGSESSATFFNTGTKWTIESRIPADHGLTLSSENVFLMNKAGYPSSEMEMYLSYEVDLGDGDTGHRSDMIAEVKTEGEKVFFRYPGQENGEWLLMYDFGLQPGEGSDIYCPYFERDSPLCKAYMQCEEIIAEDPDFDGMTTMVMSEPPSKEGFPTYRSKWIKGIGDTRGVIFNYSAGIDGILTELVEVTEGKRVVYKKPGTSVPESFTDAGLELRIEGNILTIISTPAERGSIYAIDGTEAASFTVTDAPVQISLPGKGIYVIKSGNSFRKILVK